MAKPNRLQGQIAEIAEEFVSKIVAAIRNASFADVAGLRDGDRRTARRVAGKSLRRPEPSRPHHPRQTAQRRVEIGNRILHALSGAPGPMGVRAIATKLGVSSEVLAIPLRELRSGGRIAKHGDKRTTTYSVA
jgi:hypothetical protein